MADALDLLTLAEAKEALDLTATSLHDADLPPYITAVSRGLDKLIGPVVRRTVTGEEHDGGRRFVFLRHYPVTAVTSVTEYDGTTPTVLTRETNLVKPAEGYRLARYKHDGALFGAMIERRAGGERLCFVCGAGNVEVDYTAGRYADTASVGQLYKQAARLMLQNLWRSQQDSTGGVGEFQVPQSYFPRWWYPQAVRQMFPGEVQDHGVWVA